MLFPNFQPATKGEMNRGCPEYELVGDHDHDVVQSVAEIGRQRLTVDVVKSGETVKLLKNELRHVELIPEKVDFRKDMIDALQRWGVDRKLFKTIPCQADEGKGSSEGVETRR